MALIVNGERIEDAYIDQVKEQLLAHSAGDGVPEWEDKGISLEDFAKDMVIAQCLLRQEAKERGPEITRRELDQEVARLRQEHGGDQQFQEHLKQSGIKESQLREDIELNMKIDRLLDSACAGVTEPTEEEVRAHYDANSQAFMTPERIRASHIVKHSEGATILDVQAALSDLEPAEKALKGDADFAAVAMRYSDCPDNGGDLGYFARGAMVPEFENVVFNMKVGEVSGVFQSPFGLHIAKVTDRVEASARPFEEVQDEVRAALAAERENAAIDAFTATLREKAQIVEEDSTEEATS